MTDEKKNNIIISKETARRLIKDVRDIIKHPLTENGIYYTHHETDIMSGYALIIGPEDTLYEDGFYLFEFIFPHDYPHTPPKVIYHTNDGITRFHPNLYRNGKVCLSILNTWKGETWTSCQSIRTVLLTLVTLFHNKPLLNEPGLTESHRDFNTYNEIIKYKNLEVAIMSILQEKCLPECFYSYKSIMIDHFKKNYKRIENKVRKYLEEKKDYKKVSCNVYFIRDVLLDYKELESMYYQTLKTLKMPITEITIE